MNEWVKYLKRIRDTLIDAIIYYPIGGIRNKCHVKKDNASNDAPIIKFLLFNSISSSGLIFEYRICNNMKPLK